MEERSGSEAAGRGTLRSSSSEEECHHQDHGALQEKAVEKEFEKEQRSHKETAGVPSVLRTTQVVFEFLCGRAFPRLREPRCLYGASGHMFQMLSRWPQECQVIPEEIRHVDWAPPLPEPLCDPMSVVEKLQVSSSEGTLVFDAEGEKEPFFSGSGVGCLRGPTLKEAAAPLSGPDDTTLQFESRFESGNLLRAMRVGEYDYELTLRTDLYTEKHTQWFYFRVRNTRAGVRYRFTISNLLKVMSLYGQGQQPLLYSERQAETLQMGWHRAGRDVAYFRNGRQYLGLACYSLSWSLSFPHDQDTCYLAHCYPYTYADLRAHLAEIERDPARSPFCAVRALCHSLAGNLVPVVTITGQSQAKGHGLRKPAVVLTARVHPGETNSSWVMKGILDFLLGASPDAALLRDSFVFKLVPMLNPDGVIVGNYRCSLAGRDLNRKYKSLLRESFPSVVATRTMIQRLCEERQVLLYCDLHGHSRKQNAFIYGCENPCHAQRHAQRPLHHMVFPLMLSRNCPDMFSFQSCKFKVQRRKEGTGRVALWRLGVLNSFTLETSFCGSSLGQRKGTHFNTRDLEALGVHFCDTLLDYCDPDRTKYRACLRELQDIVTHAEPQGEAAGMCHQPSTSGSNSSGSDGSLAHFHAFRHEGAGCKKTLKSRRERNMSHLGRKKPQKSQEKVLKVAPSLPKRGMPKCRHHQLNPTEPRTSGNKTAYLQHLMAQYVGSRLQLGVGQTLNGYVWGCLRFPLASHLPLFPHGAVPTGRTSVPSSHLPKDGPSLPGLLPGLPHPGLGKKPIGRSPPVEWGVPMSRTAPADLEIGSNRLEPLPVASDPLSTPAMKSNTRNCGKRSCHSVPSITQVLPCRSSQHNTGQKEVEKSGELRLRKKKTFRPQCPEDGKKYVPKPYHLI